jgi:hypothetical protein
MPLRLDGVARPMMQICKDRGPQVVAFEPGRRHHLAEHREPCQWPLRFDHRDGPIERVKGRGIDALELGVQVRDLAPTRVGERRSEAVLRRDAGLDVVASEDVSIGGTRQPQGTATQMFLVP